MTIDHTFAEGLLRLSEATTCDAEISAISPLDLVYLSEIGTDRLYSMSSQRLQDLLGQDQTLELGMQLQLTCEGNYVAGASINDSSA